MKPFILEFGAQIKENNVDRMIKKFSFVLNAHLYTSQLQVNINMENFICFLRMYVSLLFGLTVLLCSIVVMYLGIRLIQRTNRQDIWALLEFLKPYVQSFWTWWWKK